MKRNDLRPVMDGGGNGGSGRRVPEADPEAERHQIRWARFALIWGP
jgi:hypothetical protein